MRNLPPLVPDPMIEFYKRKVDRAVLRENLKLTVEERFARMEEKARMQDGDLVYGGSHI